MLTGYDGAIMCLEFYLILKVAGGSFVYENDYLFLHVSYRLFRWVVDPSNAALWDSLQGCLFLYIVMGMGEAAGTKAKAANWKHTT
jgi:hypothetical protein